MSHRPRAHRRWALPALFGFAVAGCSPFDGPQTGSQTNWLLSCQIDAECEAGLQCLCGACTLPCSKNEGCAELDGTTCVAADNVGAIAQCSGNKPTDSGFCLPRCGNGDCPRGTACVAGVCSPLPAPTTTVTVDTAARFQTLIGFGATLGYTNSDVAKHPKKVALLDAMFGQSGIDVLRLQNRHDYNGTEDLAGSREILDRAEQSLGRRPLVLLTSWTPPADLKANDSTLCEGNADTCTLVKLEGGGFDYAGFADWWRASLDAYAEAGIVPDYIGIQNNPNWTPGASDSKEACRFLPTEGSTTVSVDGANVDVEYPGFREALDAVVQRLEGLASVPKIMAPETTGVESVGDYIPQVGLSNVDAIAHHLYGTDPSAPNLAALEANAALSQQYELPILQTEMQADGLGTAILMHYTLTVENASAYVQNDFVRRPASLTENPEALVDLTTEEFTLQAPYFAMRHFAHDTAPGWVRVGADSENADLLTSAWLSPEGDALTLVLVNAGLAEIDVSVEFEQEVPSNSEVTRTAFEGVEQGAALGKLPAKRILRVPGHSIVTVAMRGD
jgi:glucuronoarabinoxylan endo-1,4-beta-xylanase